MGNLWLKIRVWTKVTVFVAIFLYAIIFIAKNGSRRVSVWLWPNSEPNNSVLGLVLCSFLLGVITVIMIRTTINTVRQIRELRTRTRTEKAQRDLAHMHVKASMLRERVEDQLGSP